MALILDTADLLATEGVTARVVSLPCWELFFEQSSKYRSEVLGPAPRVSVEAGSTFGWSAIVGSDGLSIGIDHFGASSPADDLANHFGFTPEAVAARVRAHITS